MQFFEQYDFFNFRIFDMNFNMIFDNNFLKDHWLREVPLRHTHDTWELYFIQRGSIDVDFDNQIRTYRAGTYTILPPGVDHCIIRASDDAKHSSIRLSYTAEQTNTIETSIDKLMHDCAYREITASEKSIDAFNKVKSTCKSYKEAHDNKIWLYQELTAACHLLMSTLLETLSHVGTLTLGKMTSKKNLTPMIIEFFMLYLSDGDITLTRLAESLNYSVAQTNRILQQKFGKSFRELVNDNQIRKAKYYLLRTDFSIGKISEILGFKKSKYFNSFFKRTEGVTPTQYRKIKSAENMLENQKGNQNEKRL